MPLDEPDRSLLNAHENMTERGLRVLALRMARVEVQHDSAEPESET